MRMRISPARGSGSGTFSYLSTSGGPYWWMTIAFMRVLHRSEFFKAVEIARRGFLRQSTLTSCTMRWGAGNMIEHFKSPLPTSASGEGADRASRLRGFHWRKSALRDEGHMDAN